MVIRKIVTRDVKTYSGECLFKCADELSILFFISRWRASYVYVLRMSVRREACCGRSKG